MIRVGPAGWSYEDWEGIVYPSPRRSKFDPLAYLADYFDTIELNNTFYRIPTPQMSRSWIKRTRSNPHFKFTAKLFRNFTHEREALSDADEANFKNGIAPLLENQTLGALLLQFPYSFHYSEPNLQYLKRLSDQFQRISPRSGNPPRLLGPGLRLPISSRKSHWLLQPRSAAGFLFPRGDQESDQSRSGICACTEETPRIGFARGRGGMPGTTIFTTNSNCLRSAKESN